MKSLEHGAKSREKEAHSSERIAYRVLKENFEYRIQNVEFRSEDKTSTFKIPCSTRPPMPLGYYCFIRCKL
jgi:hypothetical protein